MSGITDPSEEYFKDGLWAWVTGQWKKLIGDDAGHLQIDVVESGLPTGAATSANQTTMITALQLIDDLRAALNSVATDELDVVIDGQTVDVEIKQTTAADLTPGVMGWDGSAWRKLPLVWGYSERYAEIELEEDVSAGDVTLTFSTVPDGEVWVVGVFSAYLFTGSTIDVHFRIVSSAGSQILSIQDTGTAHLTRYAPTPIYLSKDDYLQVVFSGCPATANCYANVNGYKMKVAE